MSNVIFPKFPGLAWGSVWSPTFKTSISTSANGKEYRSANMATPVYGLSLKFEFLRHGDRGDELMPLFAFFLARKGSFDSFLYEHPEDNSVTDQLIGIADGHATAFQLLRGFDLAAVEPVMNIKQVLEIKVNGALKTIGEHYTLTDTGIVVFLEAPGAGPVTWSGSYYYRARFLDDVMDFEKFLKNLWRTNKLDLMACLGRKI